MRRGSTAIVKDPDCSIISCNQCSNDRRRQRTDIYMSHHISSTRPDNKVAPYRAVPSSWIKRIPATPSPLYDVDTQPVKAETKASGAAGNGATGSRGIIGYITTRISTDVHAAIKESEYVSSIHERAENFNLRAEEVFKYVQVFTAICDSFSNGANDVANAMGPFAAIYSVYVDGTVEKEKDLGNDMFWILALGGAGIVLGLGIYGYEIAKITPLRDFAIELGSAMMIIVGTRLEIPLSTTHCQVGSTTAVELLEGAGAVNSTVLGKTVLSWIFTILICALTSALTFAQGAYAPYVHDMIELPGTILA